uniref:uncharacterized protein LOC122592161 n=1 Tax=Erigeron canadensis TaxID=72917 RepID=UPI001CB9B7D6|nr:uncharacterized protein LOC122592161 [Erigeron canadensis]
MSSSSSSSSSSDDYESNDYEVINNVVTQMNVVFNPQAIGACLTLSLTKKKTKAKKRQVLQDPSLLEGRFRMRNEMFLRIVRDINSFESIKPLPKHFQFFHKSATDASGRPSFNIFQKCTSAIRQLAYSFKADALDEYLQMAQDTGYQYIEVHGFPGMLGSIDCMHWGWRNCPVAWQGEYTRDLFDNLLQDKAPKVEISVNEGQFQKGYYLADGIYPEWATLVKSFKCPMDPKTSKFKRYQEAARKDVERAFGVLQGRWQIIEQYARPYSPNKIKRIMLCCVILHNMIVEDNGRAITEFEEELIANTTLPTRTWTERCSTQIRMYKELCDRRG